MSSIFLPSGKIIVFNLNSNQRITIFAKAMFLNRGTGVHLAMFGHSWCNREGLLFTSSMQQPGMQLYFSQCTGTVLHPNPFWPRMTIISTLRILLLEWISFNASYLHRRSWQKINKIKSDMTVWKSKTMKTIKGSGVVRGLGDRGDLNRQRTVGNWL